MVLLSNSAFLEELAKLYQSTKSKGSVWITMKRYEEKPKGRSKAGAAGPSTETECKCLIRATDGKRTKISTLVRARDVNKFQMSLASVNKANMDGLKKREKKKKGGKGKKKKSQYV